jgi:hypothetical protein
MNAAAAVAAAAEKAYECITKHSALSRAAGASYRHRLLLLQWRLQLLRRRGMARALNL